MSENTAMDCVDGDGNSPYKCTWCVKPFRYPSQLKEHIRVHTREKPYPCKFCDKAFSHSSALTQHERIHTGEKPFNCSWCSKSFSQSSNLKRHEKVHKGTPTPAAAVAKVVKVARKGKQHMVPLSRPKAGSAKTPKVARLSPAKKVKRFTSPVVKRNLSANMASVATTGRNRMSASARDFGKPHERLGHQLATVTTALNYAGIKEIVGNRSFDSKPSSSNSDLRMYHPLSANPSTRSATGTRRFGLDENMDPVEMHRSMANRQAALGKSIEEYLSCGQSTVSPLMQDDASQFLLSKFMWSPSSVLSSPRGMSSMSMSTRSPTRSPVFMGAAQSVPVASSSGIANVQMQQAYMQQVMHAAASGPVKMESPSSYQQHSQRINSHFRF